MTAAMKAILDYELGPEGEAFAEDDVVMTRDTLQDFARHASELVGNRFAREGVEYYRGRIQPRPGLARRDFIFIPGPNGMNAVWMSYVDD
jgi:hypothetical protein